MRFRNVNRQKRNGSVYEHHPPSRDQECRDWTTSANEDECKNQRMMRMFSTHEWLFVFQCLLSLCLYTYITYVDCFPASFCLSSAHEKRKCWLKWQVAYICASFSTRFPAQRTKRCKMMFSSSCCRFCVMLPFVHSLCVYAWSPLSSIEQCWTCVWHCHTHAIVYVRVDWSSYLARSIQSLRDAWRICQKGSQCVR